MFPLGAASLPGSVLTLHVFEPRYRALVRDCLAAAEPEFGVVMIERGREVGGGEVRSGVGAVARMLRVSETNDGRYAIIAGVGRRIRVREWLADDPYPRADVHEWPDDTTAAVDPLELYAVAARVRHAATVARQLGDPVADPELVLSEDPVVATFQLAGLAPLPDLDRHRLLCAAGPGERLSMLHELLDTVEDVLAFRLQG